MRKVLIAGGDSWTDPDYATLEHPDMDCSWAKWPELLAEKLDMDCINLGFDGAGNKHIYTSIVDQIQIMDSADIGLVIPAWSQVQRMDIKVRDVWRNVDPPPQNPPYTPSIVRHGDITHRLQESILYYYSLQEICKSNNIPILQFQMLPLFQGYNWNMITKKHDDSDGTNDKSLLQTICDSVYLDKIGHNFAGWPGESRIGGYNIQMNVIGGLYGPDVISNLDPHPNAKGQIKIAEFMHGKI